MNARTEKKSSSSLLSAISFAQGNVGHAAFYGVLSIYFIMYVTNSLFVDNSNLDKGQVNSLIGWMTALIVIIRTAEIVLDPLLGNIVDNTHTRWGKFKPWILVGNVVSAVILVILFTGLFGLVHVNTTLFLIVFAVLFFVLDIFYSFSDVAYWGMVPALSEDSHDRSVFTSMGAFAGSIGWNGLSIIVVPVVSYFTILATGQNVHQGPGWFAFAFIISALALITAIFVCLGAKENNSTLRQAAKQKVSIGDVFRALAHNDQLLWAGFAYFLYSLANVVTTGVLLYYFRFILQREDMFWLVGVIATVVGFLTSPIYPILNRYITRKNLFLIGQACMIIAYLIFIFGGHNMPLLILGLVLYNFTFAQLVTMLTLTDSIEYGQWKNNERNEAVILAVRPMLDKLTGAFSNGIVGLIVVAAGMSGIVHVSADHPLPQSNQTVFYALAFCVPLVLTILAVVVFVTKVKLSEAYYKEIVAKLHKRYETVVDGKPAVVSSDETIVADGDAVVDSTDTTIREQ